MKILAITAPTMQITVNRCGVFKIFLNLIFFVALSEAFPNHHAYIPASLIQAATFVDLAQNEDRSIISLYLTLL